MALISSVVLEDFCDEFVRNGGQISFVLKTDPKQYMVQYNLIINGKYWSSQLDTSPESGSPFLKDLTTDSKDCLGFSGEYYAAVWIKLGKWCAILFAVIIKNKII